MTPCESGEFHLRLDALRIDRYHQGQAAGKLIGHPFDQQAALMVGQLDNLRTQPQHRDTVRAIRDAGPHLAAHSAIVDRLDHRQVGKVRAAGRGIVGDEHVAGPHLTRIIGEARQRTWGRTAGAGRRAQQLMFAERGRDIRPVHGCPAADGRSRTRASVRRPSSPSLIGVPGSGTCDRRPISPPTRSLPTSDQACRL